MWRDNKTEKSLLGQIQKDVVDSKTSLSDVLRQAKILATKLRNDEFKSWVDSELTGYKKTEPIPDYRRLSSLSLGTFSGPFGRSITNFQIPFAFLPEDIREYIKNTALTHGVKNIEAMIAESKKNELRIPWPQELVILAAPNVRMQDGSVLVEAWQPVTKAELEGILDQVRNRLLELILELQELRPNLLDSEGAIKEIPHETIRTIVNTTIYGGQNVVAAGTNVSQQVDQKITAGDNEALFSYLQSLGVRDADLLDLEAAIGRDGRPQERAVGPAVADWIGRMTTKAVRGVWNIGLAMAPRLLQEALFRYYGWK